MLTAHIPDLLPGNSSFFSCSDNSSYCIPWPAVCDTDPDCSDGSDESVDFCQKVGECGNNFNTPEGLITSPSYPHRYPLSTTCLYTVSQPAGTLIHLRFHILDLESCAGTCNCDYLEIRDGASSNSPLLDILCGEDTPDLIQSTQSQVWMQ